MGQLISEFSFKSWTNYCYWNNLKLI